MGSYFARCLSTRRIKAEVSTEREIKGDIARKNKIHVVRSKGRGTSETALLHRENGMTFEIPKLDRLQSSRAMKSSRGLKSLERLVNGPEIKTKNFP